MTIRCPSCGQVGRLPEGSTTPAVVRCPECSTRFDPSAAAAPAGDPEFAATLASKMIYCTRCGHQNLENNFRCTNCGLGLHDDRPRIPHPDEYTANSIGGLIPYRNARALWSYYLGIFSLIPCLGIPLGIAALTVGIGGLKFEKAHPEVKGGVHAWVGIILGGICATINTLILVLIVVAAVTAAASKR